MNLPRLELLFRCEPPGMQAGPDGELTLSVGQRSLGLGSWPTQLASTLVAELDRGVSLAELALLGAGDFVLAARFHALLAKLAGVGRMAVCLAEGSQTIAVLRRAPSTLVLAPRQAVDAAVELSRMTCMRADGGAIVLENPLTPSRFEVFDARVGELLFGLAKARTLAAIEREHGPWAPALVELLLAAKLAGLAGHEAEDQTLASWEPHDLFALGRRRWAPAERFGGTYRLLGRVPSPPPLRPDSGGRKFALARPDTASVHELGWASVLEQRRSEREQATPEIDVEALATLLHHTTRLRGLHEGPHGPLASRPYPSAGSRHPLEIYVCVNRCRGLARGFYHYRPGEHALESINDEVVAALLELTQVGSQLTQVLLIVTARFARTSWKYETNAYSLILQEVGGLLQTLHLTAGALGLASCMLDRNLAGVFERTSKLPFHVESPLGALTVGSRPPSHGGEGSP